MVQVSNLRAPHLPTSISRANSDRLGRANCTRLHLAAKQSSILHPPSSIFHLPSSILHPLLSLPRSARDNPNPSRSGNKIPRIPKKFPDIEHLSSF
jgi:hypothetical protein